MSREAIDALNAWYQITRALREATPWTSDWVRLRMIAEDQRATYEALVSDDEPSAERVAGDQQPRSGGEPGRT